ncbi:uncharacterized protein A4U43_C02F16130 [Asparagus officinalis]|uniref:Uncharacterized protein n=1 Tax=Asparagus officinalis TaxID=4686 RepID=A0A5P1FJE2_ASPOF|nr:uncharacterized protein A4U43_C02F16130 [Asparagus officinalis]
MLMLGIAFEGELSDKESTHVYCVDLEEEEEEMVDYDTGIYFTDSDEFLPGVNADTSAKPDVSTVTTMPPFAIKHFVARSLVSITESSESEGDVLISPLPYRDKAMDQNR